MKKHTLFSLITGLLCTQLACGLLPSSSSNREDDRSNPALQESPPTEAAAVSIPQPTATEFSAIPIEATLPPTLTTRPTSLETLVMGGIYRTFTVVYNPQLWNVGTNNYGNILSLKTDPNCKVHENIGMGLSGDVKVNQFQTRYGSYQVDVAQYLRENNQVFLEVINFNAESIYIAIWTGADPDACLSAGRSVVESSAQIDFR